MFDVTVIVLEPSHNSSGLKGLSYSAWNGLSNLDDEGLGLGLAGGAGDGEGVGGGFGGGVVDATRVGGPDGIGLRLELDGFGVGNAVAELDGFAAANLAGRGVEILNGQLLAAHLLEGGAVLLALLLGALFAGAMFEDAVLPPAGEENPDDYEGDDGDERLGIERRSLEEGFGRGSGFGWL